MKRLFLFLFLTIFVHVTAIPPPDTLVIATNLDEMISLDPAEVFESIATEYLHNTYDRLVGNDPKNKNQLRGALAAHWTMAVDGKKFTFYLKESLTFPSGNPITAADAAFSLQRIIKLNRTPAYLFSQFGWNTINVEESIYAEDDKTLVLITDQTYAPSLLLYCLSSANAAILDKKLVLSHEQNGDQGNSWLKTHYAGSGPFALDRWTPNMGLFLVRNDSYFQGVPKLKKVILLSVPEESSQKMLLMRGDVDIAKDLGIGQVEGIPGVVVKIHPLSITRFMSMNQKNRYLKIPQVRQALKYLIDYDNLAALTRGKMTVHQSFIPKGFFAACEDTPFHHDVNKAKELLKEAGLEQGFTLNLDTTNLQDAQALQAMFAQANIHVNILTGDSKQVITKIRTRKHDLALSDWVPDYCDPNNNATTFAYNPDNSDESREKTLAWRNAWEIPELNAITLAAMKEQDTDKRREMYLQLQRHFHEHAPFANFLQQNRIFAQREESAGKGVRIMVPLDVLSYYTPDDQ